MSVVVNTKDEIIMQLVHYFVTEENYEPIIVNGVKNEIWLENLSAPYKVIRINSNYIHNAEQFNYDMFKIKNITKQIKKKTFSFNVKTLNILLDVNDGVNTSLDKNIDVFNVKSLKDVRKDNGLGGLFPKLKTMTINKDNNIDMIINITNDINKKTEKNNKEFERIFSPKNTWVTKLLIGVNVILFVLSMFFPEILNVFILDPIAVKKGEFYRLVTSIFLHGSVLHIGFNMYALYILGNQVETFTSKWKYLVIYFGSGIIGSLLSCVLTNGYSLGASGAIFGLMGCLLYFGYHYRLYLGSVLLSQIVPVICINLIVGFMYNGIDNAAHIGGLLGGLFTSMIVGLSNKEDKSSKINGIIILIIIIVFLCYLLFR